LRRGTSEVQLNITMAASMVLDAIEHAIWTRQHEGKGT
jgi:hypothetical protein